MDGSGNKNSGTFAVPLPRWYNQFDSMVAVQPMPDEKGSDPMRVLIVDDDPPSLKMTAFLLAEEGYEVVTADNGTDALRLVEEEIPDLVILDVMMPGLDGLQVTQRIRQSMNLPIIMLSAKGETSDRVSGLDVGADDYLAKPFEPSELLARVRSVLRRAEAFTFGEPESALVADGFHLDPVTNIVRLPSGDNVELTPIEFRLLHCLVRNQGRSLSHEQIISNVWGYDYDGYSNQVAVYVRRLRLKIEVDPEEPRHLLTVRGLGYKFVL
ncbi:MAG: response regulator transcription factor [Chloroflexota bacterium]|nr:response regulator transcription factor [Chloroflexota bacterium]